MDVGTGSGCIIISLAKTLFAYSRELENSYFASDISTSALTVAKKNARTHKIHISFKQSDLLTAWKGQKFDIIVANLPYLARETDPSTKFEPKKALFAKNKGLAIYEKFFRQISSLRGVRSSDRTTKQSQTLQVFVEIGHDQAAKIKKLATKFLPDYECQIFKDLANRDRYAYLAPQARASKAKAQARG